MMYTEFEPAGNDESVRTFSRDDPAGDPIVVTTHQVSKGRTINLGQYKSLRVDVGLVCGVRQPTDVQSSYDKGPHIVRIRQLVNRMLAATEDTVRRNLPNLAVGQYVVMDSYEEAKLALPEFEGMLDPIYIKKIQIEVKMNVPTKKAYSPVIPSIGAWFDIIGDVRDSDVSHDVIDDLIGWSVTNVFEEIWRANGGTPLPNVSFALHEAVRPSSIRVSYGRKVDMGNFSQFGSEVNIWTAPIRRDSEDRPEKTDVSSWVSRVREMARQNVRKQYLDFIGKKNEMIFLGLMPPSNTPEEIFIRTAGVNLNAKVKVDDWESTRVSVSDWASLVDAASMHQALGDEWREHPASLAQHGGEHVALTRLWESQWRNFEAELTHVAEKHSVDYFGIPPVHIEVIGPDKDDDEQDVIDGEFIEENPLAAAAVAVLTAGT
ncbi:MAG: hypothetical protein AAF902_01050 [Chloroflexota bacterium]